MNDEFKANDNEFSGPKASLVQFWLNEIMNAVQENSVEDWIKVRKLSNLFTHLELTITFFFCVCVCGGSRGRGEVGENDLFNSFSIQFQY